MRLAFCKVNDNQIYYLASIKKIRKITKNNPYYLKDVLIVQDFLGKIDFLVNDIKFAKTFKNIFKATWYELWHCVNPTLKLIDLDKLEY